MAEKKAGGLYLSIGLTLSQLQSDFLAAEQTIKSGIAQLNRQQNLIRLRMEADTAGLDRVKDATKFLETQERGLNQLLDLQRDKLKLATAAYQDVAKSKGANSAAAKQLETSMERERVAVARLEAQLKSLSAQKISINTSQLQATISENIARINAKIEHIKVKTDIDVSKLGAAASEFDKAKAHVQGLNRELDLQNKKLLELKNALRNSISANGLNNVKTINLQTEIQKQIQAINQLKAKINELNNIPPPKTNNLLSNYLNIKGDIAGKLNSMTSAFANLKGATSSADTAITSVLGVIGEIPHPVGRAVAALAGLPLIFKGIENSIIEMTRQAAVSGDAFYVMSRGMQMSIADAGKFSTNAKVAGTDVNSLTMAVKQVQRQIVKGGDDSRASEWLKRYGESARNANGDLKNLNEMTFALSRALHKAQEEGKGAEFVFSVFRNIAADDITAIEDWIAVNEQASTIVKNGLANPKLAHEVKGNLNALAVQEAQLKASFESALLPVANEIIPRITDRLGRMTQVIADNKDVIKELGSDLASIWGGIETVVDKIGSGVGAIGGVLKDVYMARTRAENQLVERYKDDTSIKTAEDLLKKELSRSYTPTERAAIESTPYLYQQELRKYEPIAKAIKDAKEKIKEEKKSLAATMAEGIAGSIFKPFFDKFNQDITPDLQKYRDEVDAILYKLNHTDYENKIYDVKKRYEAALREGNKSALEQEELKKLRQAQLAQIQKEQSEKTQQYYKEAADTEYRLTHTAFEKQLRDIEQWKEAQMEKASTAEEVAGIIKNAAAKEAEAFEAAMDRIRGKLQSLDDKIFAQEHSQYEQDLRRIEQERRRYYDEFQKEGALTSDVQSRIEHWYSNAVNDVNKKAAESRTKDSDYTKSPKGGYFGGGFQIIGADQIFDSGLLRGQQQQIGLIADENQLRAQLKSQMTEEGRELANVIESTRQLNKAQQSAVQSEQQAAEGFQIINGDQIAGSKYDGVPVGGATIIQGDQVTQLSVDDAKKIAKENKRAFQQYQQPTGGYQDMEADQVVSQVQQFGDAVQQAQNPLQDFRDSTASAKSALAEAANAFSPDYFKHLAEDTKALSEMQYRLNESTEKLIAAQDKLAAALDSLPTTEDATRRTGQNQSPDDGMMKLSYRGDDDSRYRRPYSDIPQQPLAQKSSGIKLGIDYDTFKDVLLTGVGLAGGAAATGVGAGAVPAIAIGALATAITTAIAKGSYDATMAAREQSAQVRPFAEADLSGLITPVINIDGNVQSILQAMQDKQPATLAEIFKPEIFSPLSNLDAPISGVLQAIKDAQSYQTDSLRELFGTLPNIEANTGDILRTLQERGEVPTTDLRTAVDTSTLPTDTAAVDYLTPLTAIDGKLQGVITAIQTKEVAVSFETIVTPLSNIHTVVSNILAAMGNRQQPNITVSPNISVNLGGAYVFDNAMKRELIDDCTQQVADNVEQAVRQATNNVSYGYGA